MSFLDGLFGTQQTLLTAPINVATYQAAYGELVNLTYSNDPATTVTLPPAYQRKNGRVALVQTRAVTATVQAAGADTIEGGTFTLDGIGQFVTLQSDGVSHWWVVARHNP